jgi:glycosyltransferase involved in cell wall biosynthesis
MAPRANLYHFVNPVLFALSPLLQPRVVTVHDLRLPILRKRVMADYVIGGILRNLKDADLIICVSSFTANALRDRFDLDQSKMVVIPLGVDLSKFRVRDKLEARRMLGLPETANIILHVGSSEERKNIPALYRILRRVRRQVPETILLRVGAKNGTFPPADLTNAVRTFEPRDEILAYYYNAADLMVFPSLLEGFGLPLLEAMASGTPVVTSKTSSIPEVVGDAALAFDPRDELAMADSSVRLLTDGAYAIELARRGLERSRAFTWEMCAVKTREAYSKVLGK